MLKNVKYSIGDFMTNNKITLLGLQIYYAGFQNIFIHSSINKELKIAIDTFNNKMMIDFIIRGHND